MVLFLLNGKKLMARVYQLPGKQRGGTVVGSECEDISANAAPRFGGGQPCFHREEHRTGRCSSLFWVRDTGHAAPMECRD